MPFSRRSLLSRAGALGAAAGAAGLTGCASGQQTTPPPERARRQRGDPVRLTYWGWLQMQPSVDLWNSRNPDVQVEFQSIVSGDSGGYQKMYSALEAGTAPDLAQVEYYQLPAFMLVQGPLNLSAYGFDEYADDFVDWQLRHCSFFDQIYAVPQDSGPMALYYREDLFERWGIEVPQTWANYAEAAELVREADPDAYLTTFPANDAHVVSAFAWQAGARWGRAEPDAWVVDLTDEPTRRVIEYWEDLYSRDLSLTIPVLETDWYNRLQQGTIVSWVGPKWGDEQLRTNAEPTHGRWRVAPMPQWERGALDSANQGGSSTVIFSGTQHPYEAMEFAHWLNTDPESVDLLIEAGTGWPSVAGGYEGSALDAADPFFSDQRHNDVFAEANQHIDHTWVYLPTHMGMVSTLSDAMGQAVARRQPLLDAFVEAEEQTVTDMEVKDLTVRRAS